MSKALKVIGTVAAVVALVATGVGIAGGGVLFAGAGASTAAVAAATATITTVATVASVVSAAAMIGAVALQKPPPARGSVAQIIVSVDPPRPFVMGEGYVGGVIRHDVGYGATVNKVPNPYLWQVHVYSGVGPVQSITPQVDFGAVPGYYSTYLYTTTQLGLCPQSAALTPQWSGAPGWSTSSKLSGCAAIGWSARFDKDGKRFANGLPVFGAYGQWAKAYDPRKDSTRAGGSGSHRVADPTTWEYTARPALLAGSYAYGYYQNGKLIMGMGLPDAAINWDYVADWANVCDDNNWTLFGRVFEPGGPEARWANLTDICIAGGGTPVFAGGQLSFHYSAPRVALGTITADDLADGTQRVTGQKSYAQRINTVIPRFIDSASNWEQVPAAPVVASTLVTEDGETRSEEYPYNLVKNKNQAAQLAMYRIYNAREITVPEVPLLPNYVGIRPGECWTFDLPDLGLDNQDCIVWSRSIDPGSFGVTLSLETETAAKHAFALGQTGTAPDTPTLARTGEQLDDITDAVMLRTDDIADAALTANWPQVTGTGRPTDYADVTAANTAAAIAGQQDLATTSRAALPFGANLAVNSEFLLVDPTYGGGLIPVGWNAGWTGNSTNLGTLTFNSRRVQLQDVTYAFARDVTGAPNGTAMDCITGYPASLSLARFAVPVLPGERIVASALIGHQNCTGAYAVIGFSDENHAYVDEYAGSPVTKNIGAAAYNTLTRNDLSLVTAAVTVPADGGGGGTGKRRWAVIWVRFNISGSPSNPRLLVAAPLIAKVPANQTALPAYSPGPADRQASYGATTGTSLVSATYGTLGDADVKTNLGTAAAFTGQQDLATTSRSSLAFGANAFVNSDMTATAAGWEFVGGTNGSGLTYGGGRNAVTGYFGKRNVAHATWSSGSVIPNTVYLFGPSTKGFWAGAPADVKRYGLPVRSGDRVALAGKFSLHGATTLLLRVRFWSETGTLLAEADSSWVIGDARVSGPTAASGDPANFAERSTYQAAPSGSAYATWGCWTQSPGTDNNIYIFVTEPLLALIPATQTAAVIYSPGPAERVADATSENQAASIVSQAATATNSNYSAITGTKPPADADKTSINTSANTNNVGTVPSTAVQSTINTGGGVANNQVATAAIVANAVTVPNSAYISGAISCPDSTETTVQTLTITTVGSSVALFFSVQPISTAAAYQQIRVYRGSTLIWSATNYTYSAGGFSPVVAGCLVDSPAAGTYTYTIRAFPSPVGPPSTSSAQLRSLVAIETKR